MAKILKYMLEKTHRQTVMIPQGARVLYVAEQRGEIVLYAQISPSMPPVERTVWVIGTGQLTPYTDAAVPLGVVSISIHMYHVFIEPEGYRPGVTELWL